MSEFLKRMEEVYGTSTPGDIPVENDNSSWIPKQRDNRPKVTRVKLGRQIDQNQGVRRRPNGTSDNVTFID